MRHVASIVVLALMVSGCSSPTTPSAPTPVQVAGAWAQTLTETASSGGECFAANFQTSGAFSNRTLTVAQNGSTLTATSAGSGADICVWTGTLTGNTVSLNLVRCGGSPDLGSFEVVGARCPDGSGIRDFRLVSDVMNMTVVGGTATGTETFTFNILVSGTQNIVGTLIHTWAVSMTR
jgi:hypothetical protein